MPNRREFLQTGAVVSALAVNGLRASGAAALGNAPAALAPRMAIYDDRYAEARNFAAAFEAAGVPVRALDGGDVTRLYEELDRLWHRGPAAIAGLTQYGPMFVIERLAAERRLGFTLRVERRAAADTALVAAHDEPSFIHYYSPHALQQGHGPALDGPLYTWVVAPRVRGDRG